MKNILVSVIIPTHNGQRYISEALNSVLRQSYKDIEVVIVDDGSTDNTHNILIELQKKDNRIVIIRNNRKKGFVDSLNIGAKNSHGYYIARIDDDDIWQDFQKIEKQVSFLEQNKDFVLVGGGVVVKREKDNKEIVRYLFPEKDEEIRKGLLVDNLFAHSCVVFLRNVFDQVGGYDTKFDFFADADLWLKIAKRGKVYNFQEYFTVYLDKEGPLSSYSMRDTNIRRKLLLRIKMKWSHRKEYKGFLKAVFFCLTSFIYSFIPLKTIIKPALFEIRVRLFKAPYKYKRNI